MSYFGWGFTSSAVDAGAEGAATSGPKIPSYATPEDVDYRAFGEESIKILMDRDSGEDKVTTWALESEDENAIIWRGAVEGSDWAAFRVKMTFNATKDAIEAALLDVDVLLKLDDMTERLIVVYEADKEHKMSLRHMTSKAIFPIAGREFVVVTYTTELPDGRRVIASRSIDVESIQAFEGYVRAENIITGYIIEEKQDTSGATYSEVTLLAHADLAGYIPASIVNMLGTSATVQALTNLKNILEN
ncbi:hypothetical protein P43SY_007392 [Pythium insidiosum]|uniref:START domain-containing protein n=1 Tax=Pythium insidiosum TaxID=114742 RepID=A0AAD5Q3K4_PYTIN|nr:hypothetical protein P43SY_007392 [Pythium insidiosum]